MSLDRRRFLKYAGATAAVVGVSALGLDYFLKPSANLNQTSATSTLVRTPPTISDFAWTPDPEDIHKAVISFNAEDTQSLLQSAQLTVNPYFPHELNQAAFPVEDPQTFQLAPTTGTFASKSATFTQPVTVIGGKSYNVSAMVTDAAGNSTTTHQDSPYVRELENVAKTSGLNIAATYLMFYKDAGDWYFSGTPTWTVPMLGRYQSTDPNVVSRHVDVASGHGIKSFFVSFDETGGTTPQFFNSSISNDIQLGITYDGHLRLLTKEHWNIDFQDHYDENMKRLKNDFDVITQNFFVKDNCLKVDGRPLVYFYDSNSFIGNIESVITDLRAHVHDEHSLDLYLVSDHITTNGDPSDSSWTNGILPYDGITAWGGGYYGHMSKRFSSYEEQLETLYDSWSSWARGNGKGIIPSMKNGEDSRRVPWGIGSNPLPRSPDLFVERLKILTKYRDPRLNMIRIDTWNDFQEHTEIEPSDVDGTTYVDLLKKAISG